MESRRLTPFSMRPRLEAPVLVEEAEATEPARDAGGVLAVVFAAGAVAAEAEIAGAWGFSSLFVTASADSLIVFLVVVIL